MRNGYIFNPIRGIKCFRGKFYHSPAPISTGFARLPIYNRAMRTVYLDELFLLNLVINYFLLLAVAKICALPYRRRRFAAGAALGGLWSCLALVPGLAFLGAPVMHPVLALAMTMTAFGGVKRLFRCLCAFLGVSALFGGAAWAAALYRGYASRGLLFRVDMRVLVLSFALCWAAVSLVFRRSAARTDRHIFDITLERDGRTAAFRALQDTGNGLYDPFTGCAALIAEPACLAPLFPGPEAELLRGPPETALGRLPGVRLIPWAGLDGKHRLLLAFRPGRVTVDGAERSDLIVAVAPAPLDGDGSYSAIL